MKKTVLVVSLVLVVALAVAFWFSNIGRSSGKIEFMPGSSNGMNAVKVTGPYGWKCITFSKTKTRTDSDELYVSDKGMSEFPLFGTTDRSSNYYPSQGKVENIPLDKEFLFYNPRKDYEEYIVITKDPAKYESLKTN